MRVYHSKKNHWWAGFILVKGLRPFLQPFTQVVVFNATRLVLRVIYQDLVMLACMGEGDTDDSGKGEVYCCRRCSHGDDVMTRLPARPRE